MLSLVISLCCRFDLTALYKVAPIINSFVVCQQMCAVIWNASQNMWLRLRKLINKYVKNGALYSNCGHTLDLHRQCVVFSIISVDIYLLHFAWNAFFSTLLQCSLFHACAIGVCDITAMWSLAKFCALSLSLFYFCYCRLHVHTYKSRTCVYVSACVLEKKKV